MDVPQETVDENTNPDIPFSIAKTFHIFFWFVSIHYFFSLRVWSRSGQFGGWRGWKIRFMLSRESTVSLCEKNHYLFFD